jgi:hypothetical protein
MNFDRATQTEFYYKNENELFTNQNRRKLWENFKPSFENLLKKLYYEYEVKDFYFANEFLKRGSYFADTVELLFELNKEDFEDLVDSHLLDEYSLGVKYYCKVGKRTFVLEDNWTELYSGIPTMLIREAYEF